MSDGLKLLAAISEAGSGHVLRDLSRDMFVEDEIRVYEYMSRHYRRYGNIPSLDTLEQETGVAIPDAEETIAYYQNKVHDRRLYGLIREDYNLLRDAMRDFDIARSVDIIGNMHRQTRVIHTANDIRTFSEAAQDALNLALERRANPGISGVPSGWPTLDLKTGGYQPGDLVSIVARPGIGKTYLLLEQAEYAEEVGHNPVVITTEMTIEQLARRAAARRAGINPDYLRKGTLSTYAIRRLQTMIDDYAAYDRMRFFSGGMRRSTTDVEMVVQEFRPDAIYIDGAYLLKPGSTRTMNRIERVTEVFDDLKQIAVAHNLPVIATTQLNRMSGKKGKEASLETVAYTDAVSTHSSIVLSIREGDAPYQRTRRILEFLKGREGEFGTVTTHYEFSPPNFSEVMDGEIELDEDGNPLISTTTAATPAADNLDWMEN